MSIKKPLNTNQTNKLIDDSPLICKRNNRNSICKN